MAITFTNKAAGEMRERVDRIVGEGCEAVWVQTFHATCVRILRRHIHEIGFDNNFTIYDTDDSKTVMKRVLKKLNVDPKYVRESTVLRAISDAKNDLIGPDEYADRYRNDYSKRTISQAYDLYQDMLRDNNALDFDDLLRLTVALFKNCPEVLENYQHRFKYIMVDEYQDTNNAQFELVRLLAKEHGNLCVVGDDDQSIYKFRGANIGNILGFESNFPGAKVVKLEQNYRSTKNILDAANAVIANNTGRKPKRLWTDREEEDPVFFSIYDNSAEEAEGVVSEIERLKSKGLADYGDCAILYRTNAQSREFEARFVRDGVPYFIVGGVNFYSRREVKDMLAYLKTVDSGRDDVSVLRIINVPKRGIGATTIEKIAAFADDAGLGFYEACGMADEIPGLGKSASKVLAFVNLIDSFRKCLEEKGPTETLKMIVDETDYQNELKEEDADDASERIGNIDELRVEFYSNKTFVFGWRDEQQKDITDAFVFAHQVLGIPALHRLVTVNMIPDASNSNLMVMRSYQIQATRAILQRMKEMEHNDYIQKEGGYIWHTTGSGKTVTSFKVAQLLAAAPKVKNVLFIVDRVDLVDQTLENFKDFAYIQFKNRIKKVNGRELKRELSHKGASQILLISVQGLTKAVKNGLKNTDRNVIIMDEAHRSANGESVQLIKSAFQKTTWFGFTGTPNFYSDEINDVQTTRDISTHDIFGKRLHTYTIKDAIGDGNVLGFDITYFNPTIEIESLDEKHSEKDYEKEVYQSHVYREQVE